MYYTCNRIEREIQGQKGSMVDRVFALHMYDRGLIPTSVWFTKHWQDQLLSTEPRAS